MVLLNVFCFPPSNLQILLGIQTPRECVFGSHLRKRPMCRRQVEGSHHQGTLPSNGLIMLRLFARGFSLFCFVLTFILTLVWVPRLQEFAVATV